MATMGGSEMKGWAIASNFAFGVVGMVLIGWALEKFIWPGGSPWIMLGFAAAGLLGGSYRFIKDAMEANRGFSRTGKSR